MNTLHTFRVSLKNTSEGTEISLKNYYDDKWPSKSILNNIFSIFGFLIVIIGFLLTVPFIILVFQLIVFLQGNETNFEAIIEISGEFGVEFLFLILPITIVYIYLNRLQNKMRKERLRLFRIKFFEKTGLWDFIKQ